MGKVTSDVTLSVIHREPVCKQGMSFQMNRFLGCKRAGKGSADQASKLLCFLERGFSDL